MLMSGQRLQYEGEIYTLQRGFRLLGFEPVREDMPVWIAAITPALDSADGRDRRRHLPDPLA